MQETECSLTVIYKTDSRAFLTFLQVFQKDFGIGPRNWQTRDGRFASSLNSRAIFIRGVSRGWGIPGIQWQELYRTALHGSRVTCRPVWVAVRQLRDMALKYEIRRTGHIHFQLSLCHHHEDPSKPEQQQHQAPGLVWSIEVILIKVDTRSMGLMKADL
jgi:hypothetical protein